MGLRADSARSQRVSGSARTDSQRAESARNPIAANVKLGDDSALSAFTRTQWTAAFRRISGRWACTFPLCPGAPPSLISDPHRIGPTWAVHAHAVARQVHEVAHCRCHWTDGQWRGRPSSERGRGRQ